NSSNRRKVGRRTIGHLHRGHGGDRETSAVLTTSFYSISLQLVTISVQPSSSTIRPSSPTLCFALTHPDDAFTCPFYIDRRPPACLHSGRAYHVTRGGGP